MKIQDLNGKKVCILGYGREGIAMVKAIENYAPDAVITITDQNQELRIKNYDCQTGSEYLQNLERFDLIIKSPGIPPSSLPLPASSLPLTNSTQIFLDSIDPESTVIGITGSKGKSTTASLIYEILKATGKEAMLVGNIGEPAISHLDEGGLNKFFVLEMSSYQLMDLTSSPQIALVTSFFPEHLDYHGSLENYKEAKTHITKFQTAKDVVFYYSPSDGATEIAQLSAGKKIPYDAESAPLSIIDTELRGIHNLFNIAGAWKVAEFLGVEKETAIKAIREFTGLPHRLQSLGTHHDIEWVDDAISTTPESTLAALDALGEEVETIILGGQDRGSDFKILGEKIAEMQHIRNIILFPESGLRIRKAIENGKNNLFRDEKRVPFTFFPVKTMEDAVNTAKMHTSKGKICLLSTGSPSYNMFKDFEEKGKKFKRYILSS